jgi:putative ABC transport system permease protein
VVGRIVALLSLGLAAGLAVGAAASRLLGAIVYQATPRDPFVLLAVIATMGVVTAGALAGPVRRALSLDPARALRQE